jgi:hypothetical protein
MRLSIRHAVWLACICILFCGPVAAASELKLRADLDGDGQRDRVTLDHGQPYVLQVWLSASQTTWTVRSHTPIVRVVVSDLDGDNRPELITRGNTAGLTVWTRRAHRGFKKYRPRRVVTASLARTARHAVHDGVPDTSSGALSSGSSTLGLLFDSRPRAPAPVSAIQIDAEIVRDSRPIILDAFAPRPPPFAL